MKEKLGKKIGICVGNEELTFVVGLQDYNLYINGLMPENKTTPASDFLRTTVVAENAERVKDLIAQGYSLELTQRVLEGFKPNLEISVKK